MRLPIQIQAIIFRNKNKKTEFLLLKRTRQKGGFWQSPTGGMEKKDKSTLETIYRELEEETGITRNHIKKIFENVHEFEFESEWIDGSTKKLKEYVFGVEVYSDTEVDIQNNIYPEHEQYIWIGFEEALKLLKWDSGKTALKKLQKIMVS